MTLLLILVLSGLSPLSSTTIREYHYVKTLKTWAEAQSYCRETFTDLATIDNQDNNKMLLSVLQGDGTYAWIGLYDDLARWKWSLGNELLRNDIDFRNWNTSQPITKSAINSCTVMAPNGLWSVSFCWRQRPAVCYYEQGPSQYILVTTEMSWHEARAYCRSKYTDLVSVRNMSENNHISSLLSETTWIGLHRKNWAYWSNQRPSTFTNWNKEQPRSSGETVASCAVVNTTTGTWWDVDCTEKHYFVCHKVQIEHKMTFKLKFQSEDDLNDPAVQEQILEQLHAKLEKHGLPDFQLRWIETDGRTFHKEQKRKT
uniref:macrophage mannose receptor 1-like n=1 Tax=Scatophagus argus TaxID=75038 RepID=UPI001ED7F40E|nr:macrophage mannose receptor 1-like [Scatophagus argus]